MTCFSLSVVRILLIFLENLDTDGIIFHKPVFLWFFILDRMLPKL